VIARWGLKKINLDEMIEALAAFESARSVQKRPFGVPRQKRPSIITKEAYYRKMLVFFLEKKY